MTNLKPLAVITGASAGIGKATAFEFAKSGYDLLLIARREVELESLAARIRELFKVKIEIKALDLAKPGTCANALGEIDKIDVLINCAAIGKYGPVQFQDQSDWEAMLNLNCLSVVSLSREGILKMKTGGTIINISSLAAEVPLAYMAVYSATKAFVTNFSVALNEEVRTKDIRVISLNPGGVRTEFTEKAGLSNQINSDQAHMLVSPEFIAKAILRAVKFPRGVIIPARTGYLVPLALWFLPRPLKAKLAALTYRKYLIKSEIQK